VTEPVPARRVGLFGRLGSGNLGNDATLEALLGYLRADEPGVILDAICSGPAQVTALFGIPATQLHWLQDKRPPRSRLARAVLTGPRIALGVLVDTWRTVGWTWRHDVVVVPGMGVLESNVPQRPWQLPYSLSVLSVAARLSGTKVAYVSVGATVVRQRTTRLLLRIGARLAHYRSFRDEYSLGAAREMGFAAPRDRVYPDLVFALPAPVASHGPTGTVGVGVMAFHGSADDRARSGELHAAYLAKMRRFVGWLIENGYRIRFFVGDDVDEPVAAELLAAAGGGDARYDRAGTYDELLRQVAQVDVMVGTRFHNVVAALQCGKPTIAIGYGRKHAALMELMGQGEYVQDIRELDLDLLVAQFSRVTSGRERIGRDLSARQSAIRVRLGEQFRQLSTELFANPSARARSVGR
jgi:polysaccharide pyruvyl transferase WcaK-like protein